MARRFSVWTSKDLKGDVVELFVSDQTTEECHKSYEKIKGSDVATRYKYASQEYYRPRVASFPISQLYDLETQEHRAKMLCDYMNKMQEAQDQAVSQTALLDILSAKAPTNP